MRVENKDILKPSVDEQIEEINGILTSDRFMGSIKSIIDYNCSCLTIKQHGAYKGSDHRVYKELQSSTKDTFGANNINFGQLRLASVGYYSASTNAHTELLIVAHDNTFVTFQIFPKDFFYDEDRANLTQDSLKKFIPLSKKYVGVDSFLLAVESGLTTFEARQKKPSFSHAFMNILE